MIKGGWKSVGFLASTFAVLGWELVASFDGDPGTSPWTDLIVEYVPWPLTALAIVALVVFLPTHFIGKYRGRRRAGQ